MKNIQQLNNAAPINSSKEATAAGTEKMTGKTAQVDHSSQQQSVETTQQQTLPEVPGSITNGTDIQDAVIQQASDLSTYTGDQLETIADTEKLISAVADEPQQPRRSLDDLTAQQLEIFGDHFQLVSMMDTGWTAKAVLKSLGIKGTDNWARKLFKRYKAEGPHGLLDGRWGNGRKTVLEGEVLKIMLGWYYERPAAGPKAVWELTVETIRNRNETRINKLAEPGYDAVKDYLKNKLPLPFKMVRDGTRGFEKWRKEVRPVLRRENTTFSNERWQTDHTQLKIWVKVKRKIRDEKTGEEREQWVAQRVWLTVYLDVHSRSIPGFLLSVKNPDAWTTLLLMAFAVAKKKNKLWFNWGLPFIVQPDRGADFKSKAVKGALARLGIELDYDFPRNPDRKGKIERWFLTLDTGLIRKLPGHRQVVGKTQTAAQKVVHQLLTVPQLRELIEEWIAEIYHQRKHSTTKREPSKLYEETARFRRMPSKRELNNLLLKSDQYRKITNKGIRFTIDGFSGKYWDPMLTEHWGKEVEIRYNPEDLESILVYDAATGEYIGEAWLMGHPKSKYSRDDVLAHRKGVKRGMKIRIKEYRDEIAREDRPSADRAGWEEARREFNGETADSAGGPVPEPSTDIDEDVDGFDDNDDDTNYLEQFERQDRGEI